MDSERIRALESWLRLLCIERSHRVCPTTLVLAFVIAFASVGHSQQLSASGNETPHPSPSPAMENSRPAYEQLRDEEDWSSLSDESNRTEPWDRLKFIAIGRKKGWYLTLGGELRERYEQFRNPLWGQEPEDNNGYFLQRYMFHADLHFGSRVRFFAQIKSGLENGRTGGPRPTDKDELDLHQAFLDLKFGYGRQRGVRLRVGRQEMAFGSSRLISVRESPNVRQSFDGLRATVSLRQWKFDGFVTKPVETARGFFDDMPDHARSFWGVYAVRPFKTLPGGHIDLYYLGIDRKTAKFDQATAREIRHSGGTRIWGKSSRWDYNYELVYQWGSFGKGNIRAWTVASDNGYTISEMRFRPRLGLKADVTSGDSNPAGANLQTFNALFPRGAYFGEIALVGPSNHIDLHPSVELRFKENLHITIDPVFFWRQSLHDGIYGNAINLLRSGRASRARFVGSQLSVQAEYRIDKHMTWTGVVSHFLAGRFLQETGTSRNVNYVTSWVTYKF